MKKNGNNTRAGEYYIGLDIGTSSVGYAVTDTEYRVLRHGGNSMWGARLFDEGETAEKRRACRTNRRRLARRKWRLELLRALFDEPIAKVDPGFFQRMNESSLVKEDKSSKDAFSLFADPDFTDKDYMRLYPTLYHLRDALMRSDELFDVRLVYLALHHIIKNRGHFLYDVGEGETTFEGAWSQYAACFENANHIQIHTDNLDAIHRILSEKHSKLEKKKQILSMLSYEGQDDDIKKSVEAFVGLMIDSKTSLSDLFMDEALNEKISISAFEGELVDGLNRLDDDCVSLLSAAKLLYDTLILEKITHGYSGISAYKIGEYETHKSDVKALKKYIRECLRDKALYKKVFVEKEEKNYAAYSGYRKGDKEVSCTQEEFCNYLKKQVPRLVGNTAYDEMFARIETKVFAPKLRTRSNGLIPNSLHRQELCAILNRAAGYLPFLSAKDKDGVSVSEKIIKIFDYKLPYFVGPLKNAWVVRQKGQEKETIYPWNIDEIVDYDATEECFIARLTTRCTYTGEDVLPKDSLIYSKFMVLNEINGLKVNGQLIDVACKQKIYKRFFKEQNRRVTIAKIHDFLKNEGIIKDDDIVSGVNDPLTSSLSSYHKLKNIIPKIGEDKTEELIRRITLTGTEKGRLRKWVKSNTSLSDEDVQYVCRLNFTEWGRLSKHFLTEIVETDPRTGMAVSIMDFLWDSNQNLMQLLSENHTFKQQADEHKRGLVRQPDNPRSAVDELYVSPKVRKGIWQALRMVDEVVDICGAAPKKIFIEVARDKDGKNKKGKTRSRKEQLIELYRACKKDADELFGRLCDEDDARLRQDKLYLYYTQFGKCAYSGEPIDHEMLADNGMWDIDHIFPRSKIKDDSIQNRVLVKAELNREKTNNYPIKPDIQEKMRRTWKDWLNSKTIGEVKHERLVRTTQLTEEELSAFINRQLVETRQSTKAVAELLQAIYPASVTKIVYSKADNVSDFRRQFAKPQFDGDTAGDIFVKCRDINDHHHAKDAYLNIVVGNYFDTRFAADFFKNILHDEYSLNPEALYRYRVRGAWIPGESGTIKTVRDMMAKNNVLVVRQPRTVSGELFNANLLKATHGQIEAKRGRSIEKYGGYNDATSAYYVLIEQKKKRKTSRSIEAVLLCEKEEYEKDMVDYATRKWGEGAKVIIPKILAGSLFELDGKKGVLTGRGDIRLIFNQAHQLVVSPSDVVRIKRRIKWCEAEKCELPLAAENYITAEENIRLYDMFCDKLRNTVYKKWFASLFETLNGLRANFIMLSLHDQCKVLREILKVFSCHTVKPSLELIGGKKIERRRLSKVLDKCKTAYIIHQSVTGLFETKIDLLR